MIITRTKRLWCSEISDHFSCHTLLSHVEIMTKMKGHCFWPQMSHQYVCCNCKVFSNITAKWCGADCFSQLSDRQWLLADHSTATLRTVSLFQRSRYNFEHESLPVVNICGITFCFFNLTFMKVLKYRLFVLHKSCWTHWNKRLWELLKKIISDEQQSGAAEACWAHNPEVDGSKPSSAMSAVIV